MDGSVGIIGEQRTEHRNGEREVGEPIEEGIVAATGEAAIQQVDVRRRTGIAGYVRWIGQGELQRKTGKGGRQRDSQDRTVYLGMELQRSVLRIFGARCIRTGEDGDCDQRCGSAPKAESHSLLHVHYTQDMPSTALEVATRRNKEVVD